MLPAKPLVSMEYGMGTVRIARKFNEAAEASQKMMDCRFSARLGPRPERALLVLGHVRFAR
jgi:hypothetical protein